MASEAEYERLYQQFVLNGGGNLSFTGANTPVEYYTQNLGTELTPAQIADLQARQAHYNRINALQTISSEIGANNFNNPYNARSVAAIGAYNSMSTLPGMLAINDINNGFNSLINGILGGTFGMPYGQTLTLSNGSIVNVPVNAFTDSDAASAFLVGAILEATGVDFGKLLLGAGLIGAATSMFGNLQNHTNSQITDLPGTLEQTSQLADLNKQFGESPDSCSLFNELMGIMAGAFDTVIDFTEDAVNVITDVMSQLGQALIDVAQYLLAPGGLLAVLLEKLIELIPQPIKDLFNALADTIGAAMTAISELTNQIANEIAKALELASTIAQKLAALAVAAAMLDPCKMAVILNTGSPEMIDAVNKVNSPVTGLNFPINTQVDERADADTVNATYNRALEDAKTATGVPQSPISSTAKKYFPQNAYLHDLEGPVTGAFSDRTFERTETPTGSKVTAKPTTGSNSDTESNTVEIPAGPTNFASKAFNSWRDKHFAKLGELRKRNNRVRLSSGRYYKKAKFPVEAMRTETKLIKERSVNFTVELRNHYKEVNELFIYTSANNKRDPQQETRLQELFDTQQDLKTQKFLQRMETEISTMESQWESLKRQGIFPTK